MTEWIKVDEKPPPTNKWVWINKDPKRYPGNKMKITNLSLWLDDFSEIAYWRPIDE